MKPEFVEFYQKGRVLRFEDPAFFLSSDYHEIIEQLNSIPEGLSFAGSVGYLPDLALKKQKRPVSVPAAGGFYRKVTESTPDQKSPALTYGSFRLTEPVCSIEREKYLESAEAVREAIAAGNVYQVNYTFPVDFEYYGHPYILFAELYRNQPAVFSAYLTDGESAILSVSPELFFERNDRQLKMKPMKGTAPSTGDPVADAEEIRALRESEKERAENAMIVDLIRNDAGRICEHGSVKVEYPFAIENHSTVYQMTTTVTGRLRNGIKDGHILKNLFPCGSITGAPKIAAMKYIRLLENFQRSFYTGATGYIHNNEARFSVNIRTTELTAQGTHSYSGRYCTGSGVTYDSKPESEWAECLQKAKIIKNTQQSSHADSFYLFETFLYPGRPDSQRFQNVMRLHKQRLEESAGELGFPFDSEAAERIVRATIMQSGRTVLKLICDANGEIRIETRAVPARQTFRIILAGRRVYSKDPYLFHKTNLRLWRDKIHNENKVKGFDECIFENEDGFLTEGIYTNYFFEKDGRWFTAPVSDGLLPGIMRQRLLQRGFGEERRIHKSELLDFSRIIAVNSLRGIIRCELAAPGTLK